MIKVIQNLPDNVSQKAEEIKEVELDDDADTVILDDAVTEKLSQSDDDLPITQPLASDLFKKEPNKNKAPKKANNKDEEDKYELNEELKIDQNGIRRSDRKRTRAQVDIYTSGNELDSSVGGDEDQANESNGKRKLNRQFQGVMLAEKYTGDENIDNWIMSEKLDGVRCIWNGKTMKTRNNNTFYPPKFFTKDFPDEILDGELWLERGEFQQTMSIVRKLTAHDGWKDIKYIIFDAPEIGGTFATRIKRMKKMFKNNNSPYLEFHEQQICRDKEHLNEELERVIALGGEGMMVRDPESYYEYKRSDKMLKVKKAHDSEAVVLKHIKGTGRCSFMMGAILVRNNDGVEFKIGSGFTDADRRKPPKLGSIVTYKYYELTKSGKPRFPIYLRPYTDL